MSGYFQRLARRAGLVPPPVASPAPAPTAEPLGIEMTRVIEPCISPAPSAPAPKAPRHADDPAAAPEIPGPQTVRPPGVADHEQGKSVASPEPLVPEVPIEPLTETRHPTHRGHEEESAGAVALGNSRSTPDGPSRKTETPPRIDPPNLAPPPSSRRQPGERTGVATSRTPAPPAARQSPPTGRHPAADRTATAVTSQVAEPDTAPPPDYEREVPIRQPGDSIFGTSPASHRPRGLPVPATPDAEPPARRGVSESGPSMTSGRRAKRPDEAPPSVRIGSVHLEVHEPAAPTPPPPAPRPASRSQTPDPTPTALRRFYFRGW